ncbi:hypothetical protein [Candidatus Binatus soli]|uniref:hypothetical protein n=1 Tax=Candidatus Binatus soli TaxID=1953413 RepID=UPI003D0D820D
MQDNSPERDIDVLNHLVKGGEGWGIIYSYLEAKMELPSLIVGEQIPAGLRSLLKMDRESRWPAASSREEEEIIGSLQ